MIDSNLNFIKNVEKKYICIVDQSISISNKYKTPSIYSEDSFYKFSYDRRIKSSDFDLNKKDFEFDNKNIKDNYNQSNSATNFESKLFFNKNYNTNNNENNLDILNSQSNKDNNRFYLGIKDKNKNYEKNNLLNNDDI